jgi:hypothetical protein
LTEAMLTSDPGKPRAVVGLSPLRVGCPKHLHACPQCWQEDVEKGRNRYWRRAPSTPARPHLHRRSRGHPLRQACANTNGLRTIRTASTHADILYTQF